MTADLVNPSSEEASRLHVVPIRVLCPSGFRAPRPGEPIMVGVPIPRGVCSDTAAWRLWDTSSRDGANAPMPLQTRVLDRWPDGTIRWALVDFQASTPAGQPRDLALHLGGVNAPAPAGPVLSVTSDEQSVAVQTGAATFRLTSAAPFILAEVTASGTAVIDAGRSELRVIAADGSRAAIRWNRPVVEEEGPLRCAVRIDGTATWRHARLALVARLHFHAGSAAVRLSLTVRNPRRAKHPGGIWELGDTGSVLLRELSVVLQRSRRAESLAFSAEREQPLAACREGLEIYQESSGGENWQSRNHVNRDGLVPLSFRGYRGVSDGATATGLRATPLVVTEGGGAWLGAAVPEFWQNFPRAIEATQEGLSIGLFPRQFPDVHELQGGEQKTHECWILFGKDGVTGVPLDWCRSRLLAHASPEWYAATGAVPYLVPAAADPNRGYLALVNSAIEGDEAFEKKRERIDEYGWRNFGDIYADHEGVYAPAGTTFVSHYNNQYDGTYGLGVHFLRTADPRWWTAMDELARHVADIDIYHTDQDKAAYNHGLLWHTSHYVDAGESTHRSFPRAEKVWGGGPSNEHDYSAGLMLHHFLTGSEQSRESVLELAQWVIDMDDGRKSAFWWLDRQDTGLASQTGSTTYHGPGRGAGNSILTLLNAHHLTGDAKYLDKAEQLIRRCIHPSDDLEALNLLDAERRWYYNVFLQVLGRYLRDKAEQGQLDETYAYGRAALLHYARWMAEHEYPYLEKPEILEYPNETWAAQDMRKSEVFLHAALHAGEKERQRFEERAGFFFDYASSSLTSMATHTLARPTVLMLVNGYMRSWFSLQPRACTASAPTPALDFGRPDVFVPQKVRARKRAIVMFVAACALALAALVALFLGQGG